MQLHEVINKFNYIVVEKGESDAPTSGTCYDVTKYCHIALVKYGESCVFPNVDSCLALIIELENGNKVVAHIGLLDPGYKYALNEQLDHIKEIIGGEIPVLVTIVGSALDWNTQKFKEEIEKKNPQWNLMRMSLQRTIGQVGFLSMQTTKFN